MPAVVAVAVLGAGACSDSSSGTPSPESPPSEAESSTTVPPEFQVPIVFVHGYFGSGAQFRTDAMRFASNGYPVERMQAFDYGTIEMDTGALGAFIDEVRGEFSAPKVHLVAHSLGTGSVNRFMEEPGNAEKVDRFVLVDGSDCPPGEDRCLTIKASELAQTHVEAVTSAESFERQFRFLVGRAPDTTDIVAEPHDEVTIAGKALEFEVNTPAAGAPAEIWEVNPATGARTGDRPAHSFTIGADGSWGPFAVHGDKHYEIAVTRAADGFTFHNYFQPFVRDSYLIRLLTVSTDAPISVNTNRSPDHAAVVVIRYREFWSNKGGASDTLRIFTTGQSPVDVLRSVPADVVAVHVHDDAASPKRSTQELLPFFPTQPVQTGVDVYLPADDPPTSTVTAVSTPRGDTSRMQSLAAANWPSSDHAVIFTFNDYV